MSTLFMYEILSTALSYVVAGWKDDSHGTSKLDRLARMDCHRLTLNWCFRMLLHCVKLLVPLLVMYV